ncbi:AAA family ATPase [Streptomyces sp. NPDC056500]|uniref:AAA family ATPase n=1 Tax=Streptomyces sp. NPDC056500 TaxID=3345840 RepID=UPI0036866A45
MRPLLDREAELVVITAALDALGNGGAGSLTVVTGGLGMGRTALLRALPQVAEQRGVRVLTASGAVHERDFGFGVVSQLLTALIPGDTTALPGDCVPPPQGSERDAELLDLIAEHSTHRPLLLLVDDLQWADAPSLRWLDRLTRRLPCLDVALVVAVREDGSVGSHTHLHRLTDHAHHILPLRSLTSAGTAALVAAHTGRPVHPAYADACHRTTGGHPLLLTATLAALGREEPTAERANEVDGTRLLTLHERFAAVLRYQSEAVWSIAKVLAVVDEAADDELTGQLTGLDDTGRIEAIAALRKLGLLANDPIPRFIHQAVRDGVEQAMTPADAEDTRVRAALLLHEGGHPPESAARLLVATSCHTPWAVGVLRNAATTALGRTDPNAAARYLRHALLGSSPEGPDRGELLADLATIECAFAPQAALRHFAQALLLLPDPADRARVAGRIPPFLLDGCPPAAIESVVRAHGELAVPAPADDTGRGLALRLEARLRHRSVAGPGELFQCADRLRALGPMPDLDTTADRELITVLLHGATLTQRTTAAEAVPLAERVLQHEPATPDHVHTALPLLADILIASDSLATIGPWLESAYQRARRDNASVARAVIAVELTQLALAHGRIDQARVHADEALSLGVTAWATLQTLTPLALVAAQARDTELTLRLLTAGRDGADHGHRPALRQLLRGSAAAQRGDLATALECLLDWGRSAERADWRNPALVPWRSWTAGLHYRMGRPERAHDLIEEEYERAVRWGGPVAIGRAQRVRGALRKGVDGLALLHESAQTLDGSVNMLERARTSLLLGRRLLEAGRTAEAERRLTQARADGLACGVPWLARGADDALHADAGAHRADAIASLTRAERHVAGLAAGGASNKEIAERLDVTARAVEKHLTRTYRKLSIRGRTELVAMAGLLPIEAAPRPRPSSRPPSTVVAVPTEPNRSVDGTAGNRTFGRLPQA